jgi:hypothetical protein
MKIRCRWIRRSRSDLQTTHPQQRGAHSRSAPLRRRRPQSDSGGVQPAVAGAASEAGTCSGRDATDGVAERVKSRSRCGAALALVPPLCATARPLCAARPDRAASPPLPTDTPPCAAVWRKRENRRPGNIKGPQPKPSETGSAGKGKTGYFTYTQQSICIDGAPCAVKVACTVRSGEKSALTAALS